MNWTAKDDQLAILMIGILVVSLIVIRSCFPSQFQQAERPASPPESLYTPGG
tara:strand:- start:706 stop:861 length:156 start_codon:yes stop_codon:yes gene_type:complete